MNKIVVKTGEKKAALGDFYGIFYEDLNHAADGGLYAELIRNRSFEFSQLDNHTYRSLTGWKIVELGGGKVSTYVANGSPITETNPNYLVLSVDCVGTKAGIKNLGYNTGIPMFKGKGYSFSFYAKAEKSTVVYIAVEDPSGKTYYRQEINIISSNWEKYSFEFESQVEDYSCRLMIGMTNIGKVCIDMVSLFPKDTFKNRENGLRRDIAEMIADLKPRFVRFPGGCLVHDGSLNSNDRNSTYRWKNTIGDIAKRPSKKNNWNYNQSLGLGYYEYFLFSEDIGAEPLPVLPAGYNPHTMEAVPIDELGPWIDDALDLIEFANGNESTKWGAVRCNLGHPESFNLKYIAIGNEEVGQQFFDRYDHFHKAIKEKYPDIKIINSAGPNASGSEYKRGWDNAVKNGSDFVDEHYYMAPEWYLANCHRYDSYDKNGPKVFLGEYASGENTYYSVLAEAAFITGLENNAEVVGLVCYAPLLCNIDYKNWGPDMIYFNNHQVFGSSNYYLQKLFMTNTGTHLLETEQEGLSKTYTPFSWSNSGGFSLVADACTAEFTNVTVIDNETQEKTLYGDLATDSKIEIGNIDSENYTITLKAKRLKGLKGFAIHFGDDCEKKCRYWSIGGWMNTDSVISIKNGRMGSAVSYALFSVESGIEYDLKLVVGNGEIKGYINNQELISGASIIPVIEELYYTASIDENTGTVMLKVVNVMETSVESELEFFGFDKFSGIVQSMSGFDKAYENNFENPTFVSPKSGEIHSDTSILNYTFPAESVTVFTIKQKN